ncbi:unnamed protein product [Sympodiomycopsis kandeliae]
MSRPQMNNRPSLNNSTSASPSPRASWARPTGGGKAGPNFSASSPAGPSSSSSSSNPSSAQPAIDLTPYVGLPLKLTLANGSEPVTGLLFAHDASSGLVILECPPSDPQPFPSTAAAAPTPRRAQAVHAAQGGLSQKPPTGFKVIKEKLIKDVQLLEAADVSIKQLSSITPVNVAVAEKREMAASKEAALRASRIGVGVTENGQDVFEGLSKTLPCRWHEKLIIVLDEVILSEPYDVDSLRVPKYTTDLLQKLTSDLSSSEESEVVKQLPGGDSLTTAKGKARSWQRVGRVLEGERRKIAARRAIAS